MKTLFLSVHLDDAIFSAGSLISTYKDADVLTVFGGLPKNRLVCTAYDQKSGFENAEQAITTRRAEDAAALTLLGCKQIFLKHVENQYGEERNIGDIEKEVEDHVQNYDEIYLPLGFGHTDHEIVGEFTRNIIHRNQRKNFILYMDMPYYVDNPEGAVDKLRSVKYDLQYEFRGGDLGKKMLAIACYESQARITNLKHLMADERFYRIP